MRVRTNHGRDAFSYKNISPSQGSRSSYYALAAIMKQWESKLNYVIVSKFKCVLCSNLYRNKNSAKLHFKQKHKGSIKHLKNYFVQVETHEKVEEHTLGENIANDDRPEQPLHEETQVPEDTYQSFLKNKPKQDDSACLKNASTFIKKAVVEIKRTDLTQFIKKDLSIKIPKLDVQDIYIDFDSHESFKKMTAIESEFPPVDVTIKDDDFDDVTCVSVNGIHVTGETGNVATGNLNTIKTSVKMKKSHEPFIAANRRTRAISNDELTAAVDNIKAIRCNVSKNASNEEGEDLNQDDEEKTTKDKVRNSEGSNCSETQAVTEDYGFLKKHEIPISKSVNITGNNRVELAIDSEANGNVSDDDTNTFNVTTDEDDDDIGVEEIPVKNQRKKEVVVQEDTTRTRKNYDIVVEEVCKITRKENVKDISTEMQRNTEIIVNRDRNEMQKKDEVVQERPTRKRRKDVTNEQLNPSKMRKKDETVVQEKGPEIQERDKVFPERPTRTRRWVTQKPPEKAENVSELRKEENTEKEPVSIGMVKCPVCQSTVENMNSHLTERHPIEIYQCRICFQYLDNDIAVAKKHLETHSIICNVIWDKIEIRATKILSVRNELERASVQMTKMAKKEPTAQFKLLQNPFFAGKQGNMCNICHYGVNNLTSHHNFAHTSAWKCALCKNKTDLFYLKNSATRHLKSVHGFTCTIKWRPHFIKVSTLQTPLNKCKEKEKCKYCKIFYKDLNRHINNYHRFFQCKLCNKCYHDKFWLQYHIKRKHGVGSSKECSAFEKTIILPGIPGAVASRRDFPEVKP